MASSSDYDMFQQVYCLSAASNVVGGSTGTAEQLGQAMHHALNTHLPSLNGSWNVIWGPAIYKENPIDPYSGPENAWFVAVSDKQQTCVVAIAGTAFTSLDDWIGDLEVNYVVDFAAWLKQWLPTSVPDPSKSVTKQAPNDPRILCALGTSKFVWNVQKPVTLWNGSKPLSLGLFLQQFQNKHPNYKITFTGHSLAGALVPTLALGLVQSGILKGANIDILASAGPTPGNSPFVSAYRSLFPPKKFGPGFQVLNLDYFNTLDIVPQAFSVDTNDGRNLFNINTKLYSLGNTINFELWGTIFGLLGGAYADATEGLPNALNDMTQGYRPIQGQTFTGPAIPYCKTAQELFDSVYYQHTKYYWQQIGVYAFVQKFKTTLRAQPGVHPIKGKPKLTRLPRTPPKEDHPAARIANDHEAKVVTAT